MKEEVVVGERMAEALMNSEDANIIKDSLDKYSSNIMIDCQGRAIILTWTLSARTLPIQQIKDLNKWKWSRKSLQAGRNTIDLSHLMENLPIQYRKRIQETIICGTGSMGTRAIASQPTRRLLTSLADRGEQHLPTGATKETIIVKCSHLGQKMSQEMNVLRTIIRPLVNRHIILCPNYLKLPS